MWKCSRGEDAGPARPFRIFDDTLVIEDPENLHRYVVAVEDRARGSLPNKLLEDRLSARAALLVFLVIPKAAFQPAKV
jgi:hypothetical protein